MLRRGRRWRPSPNTAMAAPRRHSQRRAVHLHGPRARHSQRRHRAPPPRAVHLHPVRYTSTTRARYVPGTCHAACTPLEEVARAHHGENSFSYSELYRCVFCFLHVRLFNIYIRGAHTPPAQPTHRCQAERSGTPPVTKARRRPRVHRNRFRNLQSGPSSCSPAPH